MADFISEYTKDYVMIKKGIKISLYVMGLSLIILTIFNYRYPFISPGSKGWSIGFHTINTPLQKITPSECNIFSRDSLKRITHSKTKFLADPFFMYENGIYYIFFEHQEKNEPAKIGLLESTNGLNYRYWGNVIEEDFHLSFPQIFKFKKNFYILPESASLNNVVLYKAIHFPFKWKMSDTLIKNITLKDPALLLSDSLNIITGVDQNWNQVIYKADSLFGCWSHHDAFNVRKGNEIRPGGNFFNINGNWYLPFQNNKEGYGTGVSLYKLGDNKFEKVIKNQLFKSETIKSFNRGMHHINVNFLNGKYYLVYDGDEINPGTKVLNWKSSIKYNLFDLYNFLFC
jgi:hypothetical protein